MSERARLGERERAATSAKNGRWEFLILATAGVCVSLVAIVAKRNTVNGAIRGLTMIAAALCYHTFSGIQACNFTHSSLAFPTTPAPANSRHSSWPLAGTLAVRGSGWRLSYLYHVNCFLYLDKGLVPPSLPSPSLALLLLLHRHSLHPSIADRFLKRSERRWAGGLLVLPGWPVHSNLGGLKPAMFRFLSVWKLTERH